MVRRDALSRTEDYQPVRKRRKPPTLTSAVREMDDRPDAARTVRRLAGPPLRRVATALSGTGKGIAAPIATAISRAMASVLDDKAGSRTWDSVAFIGECLRFLLPSFGIPDPLPPRDGALLRLPRPHRVVVWLADIEGLDLGTIASITAADDDHIEELHAEGLSRLGLGRPPHAACPTWPLVARMGRLTLEQEREAREHLDHCSRCSEAHEAERQHRTRLAAGSYSRGWGKLGAAMAAHGPETTYHRRSLS